MAKLTSSKKTITTLTPPDRDTLISVPVELPASFVAALQTPGATVGNSINPANAWDTYRAVFDAAQNFAYQVVLPAESDFEDEEQDDAEGVEIATKPPKSCLKPGWEEKALKENTRQEALEYDDDDSDDEILSEYGEVDEDGEGDEDGELDEYGDVDEYGKVDENGEGDENGEVDENGEIDEDGGRVGEGSRDEDGAAEGKDGEDNEREFEREHEANPEEADYIETGKPSGPTPPSSDDAEEEEQHDTLPNPIVKDISRERSLPELAANDDPDPRQLKSIIKKNSRKRSAAEPDIGIDDEEQPQPKPKRRRSSLQELIPQVPKTYQLRSRKRKSLTKSLFSPKNLRSRAKASMAKKASPKSKRRR